jgi:Phage terminase large subunit (GpA)
MSNPYVREFLKGCEQRFSDDRASMSMSDWVSANTKIKKRPFGFNGREFQRAILDDLHPDLACIKCSQVGLSEIQYRKNLAFLKRNTAVTSIFTMPNDKMRDKMSQTRILPLVNNEPVFNSLLIDKPVRSKTIIQVDQSFGYFTGSTEGDATSIPADMILHDEVDLTDQQILGLFQSRLQASEYKIRQRFSTPTFLGYGIDAAYTISDCHEYMFHCPSCSHWQIPRFSPEFLCLPGLPSSATTTEDITRLPNSTLSLLGEGAYMCCEKCRRPIDLSDASRREWVPKFPSRVARGYRVRPHSIATISIPYILSQLREYKNADNEQGWWNTVLGEPFNDSNVRMSEVDIRACMSGAEEPSVDPSEPLMLGCDVGQTCHLVVGTPRKIVRFMQVPANQLRETINSLRSQFNILAGAVDQNPYRPLAEEILADSGNSVFPVAYATHGSAPFLTPQYDEFQQITHFITNRTMAIDAVAKAIRLKTISFFGYGPHESLLVEHLRDMIRIEKVDIAPSWQKLTGNDHFLHALALLHLASRLRAGLDFKSDVEQRTSVMMLGTTMNSGVRDLSMWNRGGGFLSLSGVR